MNNSKKTNFKQKFSNFFGSLGYLSCATQWLWAILLYYNYIIGVVSFITPSPVVEVVKTQPLVGQSLNPIYFIFGSIILITMVALAIFVIIKMPSVVAKTSQKFVHKSADSVVPTLLHIQNKKDTKKNKIKLSFGLVLAIKIFLTIAPVVASFLSQFIDNQTFNFDIAMYVGLFLAGLSLIFFGIQYALTKVFLISKENII